MSRSFDTEVDRRRGWDTNFYDRDTDFYTEDTNFYNRRPHVAIIQETGTVFTDDEPPFPITQKNSNRRDFFEEEEENRHRIAGARHNQNNNNHHYLNKHHYAPQAVRKVEFVEQERITEVDGYGNKKVIEESIDVEADGFIQQEHKNFAQGKWATFRAP